MWAVTGWVVATWLKLTAVLAVVVAVCWWQVGTDSGWFFAVCCAAVAGEVYLTGQLRKEWAHEARATWWWSP
jgi:hypothetical protein